jgi:Lar family restriction alleviation protein
MSWNSEKPLPCPFCGASRKQIDLELAWNDHVHYIICRFCETRGPSATDSDDACLKWNRRTK